MLKFYVGFAKLWQSISTNEYTKFSLERTQKKSLSLSHWTMLAEDEAETQRFHLWDGVDVDVRGLELESGVDLIFIYPQQPHHCKH